MKFVDSYEYKFGFDVALLVSAWIEIPNHISIASFEIVALLVSAWIEISSVLPRSNQRAYFFCLFWR